MMWSGHSVKGTVLPVTLCCVFLLHMNHLQNNMDSSIIAHSNRLFPSPQPIQHPFTSTYPTSLHLRPSNIPSPQTLEHPFTSDPRTSLHLNPSNTPRYPDPSINLCLWDEEDRKRVEATALEMKTLCSAIKERAIR